jgi:hypothetical protein
MKKNLTEKEIEELRKEILNEVTKKPPTIGLIGVSGVGKSSTINALFKTNLAISDTVACTKEFSATNLGLKLTKGYGKDLGVSLRVYDAPGLGESKFNDPEYLKMYEKNLPECDVILWVMTARNRAVALDQMYLEKLIQFHKNMVFGINQVDIIEPRGWNEKINLPLEIQQKNITDIEKDRKNKIMDIVKQNIAICSYSAQRKFNLEELFGLIIDNCPENRKWIFDGLKNFHYTDFLPENLRNKFIN